MFHLTDGIQYDEPSVGYRVASGSDHGRANWIDPSMGVQKHRSCPYLNRKGTFSALGTGGTKSFWLISLMINEDSTRYWCFNSWRTVVVFGGNSYTSFTLCSVGSLFLKDHFFKSKESYFLSGTLVPDIVRHFRYSDKLNCSV